MRKLRHFFGGKLFLCALLALPWALFVCFLAIRLPYALAPAAALERIFSLTVALCTASGNDLAESKISKLLLILLLPWTGAVLCIVWRRKPAPRPEPEAKQTGESTIDRLARIGALSGGTRPARAESAEYFPVGKEMYEALLRDLAAAKRFIRLEYYIVAQGVFFSSVRKILEEKAAAGLDVRLCYDDFGSSLTFPRKLQRELMRAGIEVRASRPLKLPLREMNRRNHRKIAAIDGSIAYVGGVNLADEYIGELVRFGHWKDTALRVTGEAALELAALQAREYGFPLPEISPPAGELPCAVIADDAADGRARAGCYALCTLLADAKKHAYLFTPYLAPDAALEGALCAAAAAGTDVRVMIPHVPDKRTTFLLTRHNARRLEKAGVRVREYAAGFLHAKSLVADGELSFVSSYNLDFRSLHLQAECGVVLQDGNTAKKLEEDFLSSWETGVPVRKEKFFERIARTLLALFAPLM